MTRFDPCFSRTKIRRFAHLIRPTYEAIEALVGRRGAWPARIECMTPGEIREGRRTGAGHGLYLGDQRRIKINAGMDSLAIYANFVHENLHHARPDLTEVEVDGLTDVVMAYVAVVVSARTPRSPR